MTGWAEFENKMITNRNKLYGIIFINLHSHGNGKFQGRGGEGVVGNDRRTATLHLKLHHAAGSLPLWFSYALEEPIMKY